MDIPENSVNEIFENNPSQGTLYALLAIMKENGRYNLVIRECIKALSRFPQDLVLKKILAEAYLEEGRLFEAEAEFDNVIKGMKNLAVAYRSLAEIYVRRKREDAAVESLKKYLAFSPEDEEAAVLLEELLVTAAVSSIELSEAPIDTDTLETEESAGTDSMAPQEPEESSGIITTSLAETFFDKSKPGEAREIYEKLVEKDAEDPALKSRPDEISAMMEQKDEPEDQKAESSVRQKKEKMISLLDTWRINIKDLAKEGFSE
jgi:tetratricopeptide (TPR) repeat protein